MKRCNGIKVWFGSVSFYDISTVVRFGLVSLFNGISTFVGYLMPSHSP